jgi:hypothetical protein
MVIALFVLALAMIVGGTAAVLQGWDIVLLEHGWSLVVAGSVFASGGAILLGIAAAVGRLGHLRSDLAGIRDRLGRAELERLAPPSIDPVAAIAASGLAGSLADGARDRAIANEQLDGLLGGPDDRPLAPSLFALSEDSIFGAAEPETVKTDVGTKPAEQGRDQSDVARSSQSTQERPDVPEDLFVRPEAIGRARETPTESKSAPESDAKEERSIAGQPGPEQAGDGPAAPAGDRVGTETDAELAAPARSATIVGTYTSGDNRYVMFSDGAIEADTPQGIFRFDSLEELKTFIASGGEKAAATG